MKKVVAPPARMGRDSKLTIRNDKASQPVLKQNISTRNRKGSVAVFPPIAEEHMMPKSRQPYPVSPRTTCDVTFKGPTPSASRRVSLSDNASLVKSATALKGMGKFATILKAKIAFKSKRKSQMNNDDDDDLVVELPKEPRFPTSMSAEAQYAMLKGYEDTVYDCLCKEYPDYKLALRRNKTPLTKVDISVGGNKLNSSNVASDNKNKDSNQEHVDNGHASAYPAVSPVSASSFTFSSPSSARTLRRSSLPSTPISRQRVSDTWGVGHPSPLDYHDVPLTRANSLPNVIPREKQLVLSYRLQSAMDILDTVRNGLGYNYTSPRVKACSKRIKPVKDYNRWSSVWGQEFNVQQDTLKSKGS